MLNSTVCHQQQPQHQNGDGVPVIVAERRVNYPCRAVFILILVALTVLTLGIIGSSILARFYGNQHTERLRFQCRLPYRSEDLNRQAMIDFNGFRDYPGSSEDDREVQLASVDWMRRMAETFSSSALEDYDSSSQDEDDVLAKELLDKFFTENVDLDIGQHADDEGVTKIDVPDFRDGRMGRFMHDFRYNQTVILDKNTNRCFLMPLDREKVMSPTSFRDMMKDMLEGKYQVDMKVVQENMRVVIPAISDFTSVSPRILQECKPATMRIYRLERFVQGVVKRSAELEKEAKFGVFQGRMMQYDLHNMNEVAMYEQAIAAAADALA